MSTGRPHGDSRITLTKEQIGVALSAAWQKRDPITGKEIETLAQAQQRAVEEYGRNLLKIRQRQAEGSLQ